MATLLQVHTHQRNVQEHQKIKCTSIINRYMKGVSAATQCRGEMRRAYGCRLNNYMRVIWARRELCWRRLKAF